MLIACTTLSFFGGDMKVVFELSVDTDEEMGLDSVAVIQSALEEAIHDSIPAGISTNFKVISAPPLEEDE